MSCGTCGGGHNALNCPISVPDTPLLEQVDYVNQGQKFQGNPYGGTYNPGWRNHPNFNWGNQDQQKFSQPPGFQPQKQHAPPTECKFTTEDVLAKYMQITDARLNKVETTVRNMQASIQGIEKHLG